MARLHCSRCGKSVSTEFTPAPTDTPDKGLIVRAWVECPECLEKAPNRIKELEDSIVELRMALTHYAAPNTGWELVEHADAYERSRLLVADRPEEEDH